ISGAVAAVGLPGSDPFWTDTNICCGSFYTDVPDRRGVRALVNAGIVVASIDVGGNKQCQLELQSP
ncbi:MAG: hypothetical protein OXG72_07745, partial [Acidobacteria bacterium]|nr:hypothetical protein [Acidobacteriota bacterium]